MVGIAIAMEIITLLIFVKVTVLWSSNLTPDFAFPDEFDTVFALGVTMDITTIIALGLAIILNILTCKKIL